MKVNDPASLFIFAGEQSGDLHGGHLVAAIKKRLPSLIFQGVGGPKMQAAGVHNLLSMHEFEVMGFSDVLLALPRIVKNFYLVRNHILAASPAAVILIDYPGFNLRLARSLRQRGYKGKIIQYVSPTVWAWGRHRIGMMEQTLDLLLTIYPFESACFAGTKLHVKYVGNPIQEYIRNHHYDEAWRQKTGVPFSENLVALFPGSRNGEIKRNLPILIEASLRLKPESSDTVFAISSALPAASELLKNELARLGAVFGRNFFLVPKEYTYELMRDCGFAMAKSGTVTLELGLHRRPTVVVYKVTAINRLYAKHVLKLNLPHYCIVNILAGVQVFPELIETGLTSDRLYHEAAKLYRTGVERRICVEGCERVSRMLGMQDASSNAAEAIAGLLQ